MENNSIPHPHGGIFNLHRNTPPTFLIASFWELTFWLLFLDYYLLKNL